MQRFPVLCNSAMAFKKKRKVFAYNTVPFFGVITNRHIDCDKTKKADMRQSLINHSINHSIKHPLTHTCSHQPLTHLTSRSSTCSHHSLSHSIYQPKKQVGLPLSSMANRFPSSAISGNTSFSMDVGRSCRNTEYIIHPVK